MADGGNVELVEIDGPIVYLRLQGACGSCPSSVTTMRMGIQRRLQERIPDIVDVEQVMPKPHLKILAVPLLWSRGVCHACYVELR